MLAFAATRLLGPLGFGQYATAYAFVAIFRVLPDFGMAYASTLEISRDRSRAGRLTGGLLGLQAALSVATVASCLLLAARLYSGVTFVAVALLSLDLVMKAVKNTLRWLLRSLGRYGVEAASLLLERSLLLVFGLASLLGGYGVTGFVAVFAAVRFFDGLGLAAYVDRSVLPIRPVADLPLWGELFKKGLPFAYAGVVITLVFQVDALLLEHLKGASEVGYYRAPTQILEQLTLVPRVLGFALVPAMAALFASAPGAVTSLYRRGCKYLLLAGLPIAAFGVLASDSFIPLLFGAAFEPSVPLARWLLPAAAFMFLSNFAETTLACVNRWRAILVASSVALVLNVGLNLLWIPAHGALGSARATLLTEAAYFAMTTGAVSLAGYRIGWLRVLARPLAATAVFAAVLFLSRSLGVVGASLVASVAFAGAVALLGLVDEKERDALAALLRGRKPPADALA